MFESSSRDSQICDVCDVAEAVTNRLRTSPFLPLRNLTCHAGHDVLVLHGKVPTFYLKGLAQQLAGSVDGAVVVMNQIEVDLLGGHR
ncbi:MAG TPA: BON domain-containing protein [Pirellulales bacterium]|nr:BON domain-containing protein [Pirellulales bacterium]